MELIQFNINLLKVTTITCLGLYEMFHFFLTLCFIVTKFCFSMSNYLNAYKQFLFILTVALWNVFFPPSEILCCVFKFYWLSDEGIKYWFNILINENLNIYIFGK